MDWLPDPVRFWRRVNKAGPVPAHRPDLGPCWVWTGGFAGRREGQRYGIVREGHAGPRHLAHRLAWALTNGPIPPGMMALHGCDYPPCVNPNHLSLGTHDDNMADCAAKGRTKNQRGAKHALTKLTDADVLAMRRAFVVNGAKVTALAEQYGISKGTASYILHGKTWTHLPMPSNDSAKEVG